MNARQSTVITLLDEIASALDRRVSISEMLTKLELAWKSERPDDLTGLTSLVATLTAQCDTGALVAVRERLDRDYLQGIKDVASARSGRSGGDTLTPTRRAQHSNEAWMYRVFFATNRGAKEGASYPSFSHSRNASVVYGSCDVLIPATHRFGEIGSSWWRRWRRFEWSDDHVQLKEVNTSTESEFWYFVGRAMQEEGDRSALIFVHGYNVTFEGAAIRAAQIGFDLKVGGATAFFSWPSRGTLAGYPADAAAIEASEVALGQFLSDFANRSGADVVHVVAHSMGNRGLLRALQRFTQSNRKGVKFGQLVLAAPDVDVDLFISLASSCTRFSNRTTLYASDGDRPVATSAWLYRSPRAGYFPPVTVARGVERLDTVTVPNFNLDLLGHSYFAAASGVLHDMFELIRHNTAPIYRQRLAAKEDYWVMLR
jgi:esterase/lipase superfamily enzyme